MWLYKCVTKIVYFSVFLRGVEELSILTTIGIFYILFQINNQTKHKNTLNYFSLPFLLLLTKHLLNV